MYDPGFIFWADHDWKKNGSVQPGINDLRRVVSPITLCIRAWHMLPTRFRSDYVKKSVGEEVK